MELVQAFQEILEILEKEKIQYMVVGSIASIAYGDPRITRDIDVVIELSATNSRKIPELFPEDLFYVPPDEVIADEVLNRGQFNIIHLESGLKADFILTKVSDHSKMEFSRKKKIELFPGFEAFIASPEDVILKKLHYYREGGSEKHIRDIQGILAQTIVDSSYVAEWAGKLGLTDLWENLR